MNQLIEMPRSNSQSGSKADRRTLLVFADDWGRHPSSCQHLIQRLVTKYRVLWVNTIGTRAPRFDLITVRRGLEKLKNWGKLQEDRNDFVTVIDPPMLPWNASTVTRWVNEKLVSGSLRKQLRKHGVSDPIVLTTLPHVCQWVSDIGRKGLIYYCTDDYSQWPGADQNAMLDAERRTLDQADLVLAVSHHLVSRCQSANKCEYFPHGVDFEHFSRVHTDSAHPDMAKIPEPRIGFFGLIYEKIDFELLTRVAKAFSDASLVLIGPIAYCPKPFRDLENVHLLGPKTYQELPEWLAGLDVLLLPYVLDEMIRQSNPLKLRECLATGLPVVSVEVPESRTYVPHVRVAETHDEFLNAIRESLLEETDSPNHPLRQLQVESETWEARAGKLMDYLEAIFTSE